ncbi:MAG: Hsp20/alpha crystallin family protein [Alphaproteobacteria bacterium]|nr:MAG: Hsp20/alpha crystallin family protein [Alphaproteobacteria bacterium]
MTEKKEIKVRVADQEQPPAGERMESRPVVAPRTDIYETADGIVFLIELPGVRPEDADVTVEKNVLSVRARRPFAAPKGLNRLYAEWRPRDFERRFTLGPDLDTENVEAKLQHGVLRLALKRRGPEPERKIKIEAA